MGKRGRARRRRGEVPWQPLPGGVAEVFETAEALFPELQSGVDLSEAVSKRETALQSLTARFDAVHLLGQVTMGELPLNADTYRETEHPGRSYVVELVAAQLLTRPSRAGTEEHTPVIDAGPLGEIRRLTHEAVLLESFRRYRSARGFDSSESAARARAATHNLMVRNPGWAWQEQAVLRGIFEEFSETLKRALGFDADEAIRCAEAPLALIPQRIGDHMQVAGAGVAAFDESHPGYTWASVALGGWQDTPPEQQAMFMPAVWAMNHVGDALLLSSTALAEAAEVRTSAAAAYLSALSRPFGQSSAEDWFTAAERVRYQPYVQVADDTYMLTVPGNDLWALRGLLEAPLKQNKRYIIHRGRWLERRAGEFLVEAVTPDESHRSVEFTYHNEQDEIVAGEIDQLIRCGDTVLTVEAKSATLRPGARRGGDALISHLRENLTKAATQGTRAIQAVRLPTAKLRAGGEKLTLGEVVREVHPIVVTLDDLSSVAPVLWELEGTRVMPEGVTIPWVVTLHELEQICELVDWPVQLIHFLRRRSRLNQLGGLTASDELDWWMHYLLYGLYFEDRDPSVPQRLLSLTDDLDAWNLWAHGQRRTEAPRPTMNLDARTRSFLDLICDERPDGWVPAACTFLDVNGEARDMYWKGVQRLRIRAQKRQLVQRMTQGFAADSDPFMICAAVLPGGSESTVLPNLVHLVDQRLDEHGDRRVLGIGVVADGDRPYDALLIHERQWWSLPRDESDSITS
jgi:hypothetical protein